MGNCLTWGGGGGAHALPHAGIRTKVEVERGSHMTSVRGSLKKAALVAGKVLQGAGFLESLDTTWQGSWKEDMRKEREVLRVGEMQ